MVKRIGETKKAEAIAFLQEILSDGVWVPRKRIMEEGRNRDISATAIEKAANDVGVESRLMDASERRYNEAEWRIGE